MNRTDIRNFINELVIKEVISDHGLRDDVFQSFIELKLLKPLKITVATKQNNFITFCCDEIGLAIEENEIDFCIDNHLYYSENISLISQISYVFASKRYYRMECERLR